MPWQSERKNRRAGVKMPHDGKHFKLSEFTCRCGRCENKVTQELIDLCDEIRAEFGSAVRVNSGYRCPAYNATIPNSAKKSQHIEGKAADLSPMNGDIYGLRRAVARVAARRKIGGIGWYKTFVHVDVRDGRSRWDG